MTPDTTATLPTPGVVTSVNLSAKKTMRKTPGTEGTLILDRGFEGDAHAGDWHRQVSLLASESIGTMQAKGLDVDAGDFAENITTKDFDLLALPIGSVIKVGESAVLEISQIGKVCHTKCAIYYQAGDCVMPREGIFAVVREPGEVRRRRRRRGRLARRRDLRPHAARGDRRVRARARRRGCGSG